jgi:hypothetical protein
MKVLFALGVLVSLWAMVPGVVDARTPSAAHAAVAGIGFLPFAAAAALRAGRRQLARTDVALLVVAVVLVAGEAWVVSRASGRGAHRRGLNACIDRQAQLLAWLKDGRVPLAARRELVERIARTSRAEPPAGSTAWAAGSTCRYRVAECVLRCQDHPAATTFLLARGPPERVSPARLPGELCPATGQ